MEVRRAKQEEVEEILDIYAGARDYMRKTGNPTQWSGGYPDEATVLSDMSAERLYVLCEGDELYGVFALLETGDSDYDKIDGAWLNSLPYAAMHRVASAGKRGGVVAECVNYVLSRFSDVRIDTHEDNLPMQRALEKFGFVRCGKVHITRAGERIAYHYHRS
ncbi:MAG: GNAT family N-acetyltransferase [Clostridia bacterium]|nr:GNAT family N-acetyltransferase [Clostridia bacterium]